MVAALGAPVLDPDVQLFWRDTQRFFYPFKLAIAERLRRGELPLWDPWTESGASVLGQLTPGLWHPATLLYLALPFPLAFKLNHLIALPLAATGAFLLARRLGAQPWAASIAATTWSGSGFLCAMAASNLPFALGHATLPLAVWAILRFVDAPSAPRLLVAGAVLGSCGLAGEPQSMLLAAIGAAGWAMLGAGARAAPRALARLALCGACGVLLSAPATLPAAERLRLGDSRRLERAVGVFALDARRLPGLALPWAFDDAPELTGPGASDTPYSEYFSGEPHVAFAGSIALGVPVLVLAAFGGPGLLAGAALFLLAALGPATPIEWLASHLIPGFALFRYPEKLVGPATLLIALAAAAGAQRVLAGDPRAARRVLVSSGAIAAVLFALRIAIAFGHEQIADWLVQHGRVHAAATAPLFVSALSRALLVEALLAAGLAAGSAAPHGARRCSRRGSMRLSASSPPRGTGRSTTKRMGSRNPRRRPCFAQSSASDSASACRGSQRPDRDGRRVHTGPGFSSKRR